MLYFVFIHKIIKIYNYIKTFKLTPEQHPRLVSWAIVSMQSNGEPFNHLSNDWANSERSNAPLRGLFSDRGELGSSELWMSRPWRRQSAYGFVSSGLWLVCAGMSPAGRLLAAD